MDTDSKALREALQDLCTELNASRDIPIEQSIVQLNKAIRRALNVLAAAPASPAGSGASEPLTASAFRKEALDRLIDDMGIDERLENFFLRHAPVLWDDSWRCACSQWVLSRERNTIEQANKSRAEHLTEQFRAEFDMPQPPAAVPSEWARCNYYFGGFDGGNRCQLDLEHGDGHQWRADREAAIRAEAERSEK